MSSGLVAVKPARAGMNLKHPAGGRALPDEGGMWPNDGFTYRRIQDGGVTVLSEKKATESFDDAAASAAEQSGDEKGVVLVPSQPKNESQAPNKGLK